MSKSNMELDSDDYTAVPLTLLDATVGNAEIVARASLTLNKPLSFEKLRESWYRTLAARPIMQARVRRSATAPSGLEYHVLTPKGMRKYLERQQDQSTTDHLRDFFCLDESHRSIADYCPGLGIGTESAQTSEKRGIFVSDNADEQDQERCTAYNGIKSLQELLTSDRPIATIQVTRFSDATLISISVSHIIGDLFTIKALFKSWETALHGDIVEPFDSAELGVDPFANYGPGGLYADTIVPGEELPSGWRVYGGLDKARLISRVLWDQKVTRPEKTISQKYIYIPEEEVRGLLEDARADLAKIYPDETSRPTLSRSNVIYAWILKHTHAHLSPSKSHKSTPVAIANARGRPPTGLTPRSPASSSTTTKEDFPSHDFYGAALLTALPSLPIQAIQTLPLGQLSLYVRQGLTEATSPENTRKWLSFNLANNLYKSPTGKFAFWSPPDHYWVGLSDWRLIKLQEVDFSPAFSTDGAGGTVSVTGFNSHMVMSGSQRNRWVCLGEAGGGVWILGITGESEWRDQRGWGRYPRLTRRKKRASKL